MQSKNHLLRERVFTRSLGFYFKINNIYFENLYVVLFMI